MKYIMVQTPEIGTIPAAILFTAPLTHKAVAEALIAKGMRPISAGFYDPEQKLAFGFSDSLGMTCRREDGVLISSMTRATLSTAPKERHPFEPNQDDPNWRALKPGDTAPAGYQMRYVHPCNESEWFAGGCVGKPIEAHHCIGAEYRAPAIP